MSRKKGWFGWESDGTYNALPIMSDPSCWIRSVIVMLMRYAGCVMLYSCPIRK